MEVNQYLKDVPKADVSELVKKLRAEGKPRCCDVRVQDENNKPISAFADPNATFVFNCKYATVAYDNKGETPSSPDNYGQAVVVDSEATFAMTVEQLLSMVTATAWTRIPKEELGTLAEEANNGLVLMSKWVAPTRKPGAPRKVRLLSDPNFVTILVQQLHSIGKKHVGNTTVPLDESYILGLDASIARKAFTAKGAPYAAAYAAAQAQFLASDADSDLI